MKPETHPLDTSWTQIALGRLHIAARQVFTEDAYDHLSLEPQAHRTPGGMVALSLQTAIARHQYPQESVRVRADAGVGVDVPAGWWQHWKSDHASSRWWGWVARHWPVRTVTITTRPVVTVTLDKSVLFPQLRMAYPPQFGEVTPVVLQLNRATAEYYRAPWRPPLTEIVDHGEYDPAEEHRRYRDWLRSEYSEGWSVVEYPTFSEWRQRQDEERRRRREIRHGW